jgi:hypothetical protein
MRMFLRKGDSERDPLVVVMSGARRGERILQVGLNDAVHASLIAQKASLTGFAVLVAADTASAAKAQSAIDPTPVVQARLDALPFLAEKFDVAIINGADGLLASLGAGGDAVLAELRRLVRQGGRLVSIEPGSATGLLARFRTPPPEVTSYQAAGGTVSALSRAGFKPARELADKEGIRFVEGFRS